MAKRAFYNQPVAQPPAGAPADAAKAFFAAKLQRAMIDKGWNQSELARQASKHLADKKDSIGRDLVSNYIRGLFFPQPDKLEALAKALGVKPADLVPTRGLRSAGENNPGLDTRDLGDGNAWLRVNQAVPWDLALDIMKKIRSLPEKK